MYYFSVPKQPDFMPDILIADDHSAVRHGLALLARQAIGNSCEIDFARSGEEALGLLREQEFRLLFSDLVMPDRMGVGLIGEALALQPELKIIVVSVGPEEDFAERCISAGAMAYINKGAPDDTFIQVISSVYHRTAANGRKKTSANTGATADKNAGSFNELSRREWEIVTLLLKGMGVLEIANALQISASTASTLKGRAFQKLKVQSVVELSRLAYYHGFHSDGES